MSGNKMSESSTSKTPSQLIEYAGSLISEGRKVVDKGLSHIKSECLEGEKVSVKKMDGHQLASFELAYCVAELTASEFILDYSTKVRERKSPPRRRSTRCFAR